MTTKTIMQIERLAKYAIQATLGRGAMGVVYQAYDPDMERLVAIKTLRSELLAGDDEAELLRRFRAEAKAYGRLLHPNIVTCYSCDRDDDVIYIVMEYVEGESLKEKLAQGESFPPHAACDIATQLLSALAYSHANGVIHRDVKPANIMMMPSGQIKVTDFGVAKIDTSAMTQAGYVIGSPSYMSPEQLLGQSTDHRTDVYSAGIILYELLTGENPYAGADLGAVVHNVLQNTPEPPSYWQPAVSAAIDGVVMKALNKDPGERFQSADEFASALQEALQQAPDIETEDVAPSADAETVIIAGDEHNVRLAASPARPAPRPATLGAIAAVVLAVGLGGYVFLAPSEQAPHNAPSDGTGLVNMTNTVSMPNSATATALTNQTETALDGLLARYPCADLTYRLEADKVILHGYVATPDDAEALQRAAAALPGVTSLEVKINVQPWPYCELLALLKPHLDPAMGPLTSPTATIEGERLHFQEGDKLEFSLATPAFPANVYADYFLLDGSVAHLLPDPTQSLTPTPPGTPIHIGAGQRRWEIAPPFGREMIAVISSDQALWNGTRPEFEDTKTYLEALSNALKLGDAKRVSAQYAFIVTRQAPRK